MSLYRTLGASAVGGGIGAASADNKEDALRRGLGGALLAGGAVQLAKGLKGAPTPDKNLGVAAPAPSSVKTPDLKTTGASPDKISPDIKVPNLKQPQQKLLTPGKGNITSVADDTPEYIDKAMRARLKEQNPNASRKEIDDMFNLLKGNQAETAATNAAIEAGKAVNPKLVKARKTVTDMFSGNNPFEGLTTQKAAKSKYRELMRKLHPDKNRANPQLAQDQSSAITNFFRSMPKEASLYENPTLHFFYDELLRNGVY